MSEHLKATRAPVSKVWPHARDWSRPLPDGSLLADMYAWEDARVSAMRAGVADAFWYLWVPQLSLSVSRREAAKLGEHGYCDEEVAVRNTGGTAVPQGPGTINITLFTLHDRHPGIRETYERVCAALSEGFDALSLSTTVGARAGSFCDGDYNLLHEGRKLVGTAQRWANSKDGRVIGHHHNVVLAGGDPRELCARTERLYAAAGMEGERYDPSAHSGVAIEPNTLREAMRGPLDRLVGLNSG